MKRFILNILLTGILSFCLASCVSELFQEQSIVGEEELCDIKFTHKDFDHVLVNTKATLDITQESRVLNMFVFIFTNDGTRIYS